MRKQLMLSGAIAMAAILPATPAFAGGSVIISDETCGGFVPTVDGGVGPLIETTDSHQVVKGNKVTLTCHFDIPAGLEPPRGTKADGVTCRKMFDGQLVESTDSRMSASPGGRATATCRFVLP